MDIRKWSGVIAAVTFSSTVFAVGTPPTIRSACVTFPQPGLARITGIVTDPDRDALAVAPLVVGACLNPMPNVVGVMYVCDVPSSAAGVTLVAVDTQYNFSAPVQVNIALGCKFF